MAGREQMYARLRLAARILRYLNTPQAATWASREAVQRMSISYELRIALLHDWTAARKVAYHHEAHEKPFTKSQLLQKDLIRFQQTIIIELQQEEKTSDELLLKLENELDLEETRLDLDKGLFQQPFRNAPFS